MDYWMICSYFLNDCEFKPCGSMWFRMKNTMALDLSFELMVGAMV